MTYLHDMGRWSRAETELFISFHTSDPTVVSVHTNWRYYVDRVQRCEAFELLGSYDAPEGGRDVRGRIDQREFKYIWLRKQLFGDAAEEFARRSDGLVTEHTTSEYRSGPHERETVFSSSKEDSYWLRVDTDMAVWIRRLNAHPYAVCVLEESYTVGEDEDPDLHCVFLLPRSLLTIRKARPQISDERRAELAQQLGVKQAAR